jgi:hypothetical protein
MHLRRPPAPPPSPPAGHPLRPGPARRRRRLARWVGAAAIAALWLAGDAHPGPPSGDSYVIEHGVAGFGGARAASSTHVAIGYIGFPGAGQSSGGGLILVGGVTGVSPLSPPSSNGFAIR